MKINLINIALSSVLLSFIFANNLNQKQASLNNIKTQIENLEDELKTQIENQEGAEKKLSEIKTQINVEKKTLIEKKEQENYQNKLVKKANSVLDSLIEESNKINNQKNRAEQIIQEIEIKKITNNNKITILNDSLTIVQKTMDSTLDTLSKIKMIIKNMIGQTIIMKAPNNIEFIIESNTWDNFILYSEIYDMLIDEKKEQVIQLFQIKDQMSQLYQKNLIRKNQLIKNKKEIKKELGEYKKLRITLNNNIDIIKKLILEKENIYTQIYNEYQRINNNLKASENKIDLLKIEKNKIQKQQKEAVDEKKRIEYALILKKESRNKVEQEIKKMLLQTGQYKGSNLMKYKNQLPWPINGDLLNGFGLNTLNSGSKFDYNFIEIVGNEILYLVNEINPKNPDKSLVKQFQKITMNLKEGDMGYGVFGPQTTKKWKEYNQIISTEKNKNEIIAIHEGKIETIRFIDPLTGVLIIIKHNDQSLSTYSGHIDLIVKKGDIVVKGQKIGLIKPENILAFLLVVNGEIVNPQNWLIKK